MKCKICREKAVAELPQHRMALCQPCYLDWFPGYAKKTIKKFKMLDPGERILVAISGGKDSGALWRVLVDLGYEASRGRGTHRSPQNMPVSRPLAWAGICG